MATPAPGGRCVPGDGALVFVAGFLVLKLVVPLVVFKLAGAVGGTPRMGEDGGAVCAVAVVLLPAVAAIAWGRSRRGLRKRAGVDDGAGRDCRGGGAGFWRTSRRSRW